MDLVEVAGADGVEVRKFFELHEPERGLHFHRFEIVSDSDVTEFAVVVRVVQFVAEALLDILIVVFRQGAAPVAIDFRFANEIRVIGHHHAAGAARGDIVRGVETRGGDV